METIKDSVVDQVQKICPKDFGFTSCGIKIQDLHKIEKIGVILNLKKYQVVTKALNMLSENLNF